MTTPKPAPRKSPTAQITMPPRYHDAAARLTETLGEPSLSALVRRLIDDRIASLPRRDVVVKAEAGWQVQRWTPAGIETLSAHRTRKEAEAAARGA